MAGTGQAGDARPWWTGASESRGLAMVVEDDHDARKFIRLTLRNAGFQVLETGTGEEAMELFHHHPPRMAVLDLRLPGMDGFEVCRRMRAHQEHMGILILSGRDADEDKVSALNQGADDYLVKPIGPDVLVARINAVLRRCSRQAMASNTLILGDLRLDMQTMKVFKDEEEIDLTPRELALLSIFLRHPREVLSREELCAQVWGQNHFGNMKALDVYVCKLREKLEKDPSHPIHFLTERGVGFLCR